MTFFGKRSSNWLCLRPFGFHSVIEISLRRMRLVEVNSSYGCFCHKGKMGTLRVITKLGFVFQHILQAYKLPLAILEI